MQGRYIPTFAAEVYDQNEKLRQAGLTPINLVSIMIGSSSVSVHAVTQIDEVPGNGCTDWSTMLPSYHDMMCSPKDGEPFASIRSVESHPPL